jgi:hypothetical protein
MMWASLEKSSRRLPTSKTAFFDPSDPQKALTLGEAAQRVARERHNKPGLLDVLRRWVEEKYNLPLTHESFQGLTIFELLIWFWEDHYSRNPIEAKRVQGGKEVQFTTGDPLLDKWEEEIARGLVPDLMEGLTTEQRRKEEAAIEELKNKKEQLREAKQAGEGFSDDYSDALATDLPVLGRG